MQFHELLEKEDFPSLEKTWESIDYEEWVKRSFLTALLDPYTFTEPFTRLLKESRLAEVQEEWSESEFLVTKTLLPVTRMAHHFSGQLGTKDKIICYMFNPKLDVHSLHEFKRILFLDDEPGEFSPDQIKERLKTLQTSVEERKKLVDFFWEDELNKYGKKTRFIQQLGEKGIKAPSYGYLYKIVGAALTIQGIRYNKNTIWQKAHENVVTIDIIPYFSSYWTFPRTKEMLPYLIQALRGLELVRNDSQTIIFFGAVYRTLFEDILQEKKGYYFPYRIEELSKIIDNEKITLLKMSLNDPSGKITFHKHNMYCIVSKKWIITEAVLEAIQKLS